jgi:hypothetical protein
MLFITNQIYLTTDGHSVSLSWYQAAIRDLQSISLSLPRKIFTDIAVPVNIFRGSEREIDCRSLMVA